MKPFSIAAIFAVIVIGLLVFLQKRRSYKKAAKEQLDQHIKEKALDRALQNELHMHKEAREQQPLDIQYVSEAQNVKKGAKALRLTEVRNGKTIVRQYLFQVGEKIYIGQKDNIPTIFTEKMEKTDVYCEFYASGEDCFVRSFNNVSRLIRKNQSVILTSSGIKLHSGDVLETPYCKYQVELI